MSRDMTELLRGCAQRLGVELDDNALDRFDSFGAELKKWNRKINLTAIRDDRDIIIKHFSDSLSLLPLLGKCGSLLDLGSGGGFPAIPLKIVLPELSVVSVDAVEKKILFQRHTGRLLHLHDFTALHARGEELVRSYAGCFDWVVSRAFSDLPYFITLALPLIKDSGRIIAMKGREGREEAAAAGKQLAAIGVRVTDCVHLRLPVTGDDRYLIVMGKVGRENGG